jgi:hypothetical protein
MVVEELIGVLGIELRGQRNVQAFTRGMNDAQQAVRRTATAMQ